MAGNDESPTDPAEQHARFLRSVLSLEPNDGSWRGLRAAKQDKRSKPGAKPPARDGQGAARRPRRSGNPASRSTPPRP